jgi:hypothetical protein
LASDYVDEHSSTRNTLHLIKIHLISSIMATLKPGSAIDNTNVSDQSDDEFKGVNTPIRRSHESSPTSSLYNEDASTLVNVGGNATAVKEYSFYNTTSRLNLRIVPGSVSIKAVDPKRDAIYYVNNSSFMPGKPDVTLSAGSEKGGKVVGVCRMRFGLGTYNIALGDPGKDGVDAPWEMMKRHGVFGSRYWEFSLPVAKGSSERRTFRWKRTHDKSIDVGGLSLGNKKLIDQETQEIVAVYLSNQTKSWKKRGKLLICKDYGEDWELMVLITLLALLEKQRRDRRKSRSAAAGAH